MNWFYILLILAFVTFAGYTVFEAVLLDTELGVLPTIGIGLLCAGAVYYPTKLFVESFKK